MPSSIQPPEDRYSLQRDWQSWLVVCHMLPAGLQRDVVAHALWEASGRTVLLRDLFEEDLLAESTPIETWVLRPLAGLRGKAAVLQAWTRGLAWGADNFDPAFRAVRAADDSPEIRMLRVAAAVAARELGDSLDEGDQREFESGEQAQPSLRAAVRAIHLASAHRGQQGAHLWPSIDALLEPLPAPLRLALAKHVADLCARADDWEAAHGGYRMFSRRLRRWQPQSAWRAVRPSWVTIGASCLAEAERVLRGPGSAAPLLAGSLAQTDFRADVMRAWNLGVDATNSAALLDKGLRDWRVASVVAPLAQSSHDFAGPVAHWLRGRHGDASAAFSALLKRQIALGDGGGARATRCAHARVLAEWAAAQDTERPRAVSMVRHACELLIEGGRAEDVARINWSAAVVASNLRDDPSVVSRLTLSADSFPGDAARRAQVVIALFSHWIPLLGRADDAAACEMWSWIALAAKRHAATFHAHSDVARPAFQALRSMRARRPELRGDVAQAVAAAIVQKASDEFMWARAESFRTAVDYADAFRGADLIDVTLVGLASLESGSPEAGFWPASRPVLDFLVTPEVIALSQSEAGLPERILRQILRYGLEEEGGAARLLFRIRDFDKELLADPVTLERLGPSVEFLAERAGDVHASDAVNAIYALLSNPSVAGTTGTRAALDGLSALLRSAEDPRPGLAIGHADGPLLVLAADASRIRAVIDDDGRFQELAKSVRALWRAAGSRASLLAPFSFPPAVAPNPIVVHNLAFATLRFARATGCLADFVSVLQAAAENPELRSEVEMAFGTDATGPAFASSPAGNTLPADAAAFYKAIGRNLARLRLVGPDHSPALRRQLLAAVIRLGPRLEDAAVLALASAPEVRALPAEALRDYVERVENSHECRLLLLPMIHSLQVGGGEAV